MAVLDKHKYSLTIKWLTRVVSLHIIALGRSVMFPDVAGCGPCISEPSPGEDTWEKNNKKSVIICTVTKDVDTSRLNSYICPHSFTPLTSNAYIPQRCGRGYIKETGIFFKHSAARRGNGAKPEGTSLLWRHDNTANALFSFWRRHISRCRRRWYRQTGEGEAFSSDYSFFLSISALAQVHVVIMYTHRTTVLLWCSGLCGIRVRFSVRCMLICVAYSTD